MATHQEKNMTMPHALTPPKGGREDSIHQIVMLECGIVWVRARSIRGHLYREDDQQQSRELMLSQTIEQRLEPEQSIGRALVL
jgi:hypothetical protein